MIDIRIMHDAAVVLTAKEYKQLSENRSIRMERLQKLVVELYDLYKRDSPYYPEIDREMYALGLLEGDEKDVQG